MILDFLFIIINWAKLFLWQLIFVPFLIVFFKDKLFDGGWAWSRLIFWLTSGLIIWFAAHLGIPANTELFLWLLIAFFSFFSIMFFKKNRREIVLFISQKKYFLLFEEVIFFAGFLFITTIRSYNPDILDLEKFMDAGLMYSYLRSPILPLEDMWLAGETFNYYTFGHFLGSQVASFWGLSIDTAYNLLLGFVFGLLLMQVFSLVVNILNEMLGKGDNLSNKVKLLISSGIIGSILVAIGSNSHPIWYFIKNKGMSGFWYPDSTRYIENTIHEFPSYSFVVSDLHAHVWSLPIVLLMILVIWLWSKYLIANQNKKNDFKLKSFTQYYLFYAIIMGVLLGILAMTSTWDAMIYSILLGFVGLILLTKNYKFFQNLFISATIVVIFAIITSSAWWLNFESISEGIRFVQKRSSFYELAVLWGGHFSLTLSAGLFIFHQLFKKKAKHINYSYIVVLAMTLTASVLLILPEIIFFKDIYPDHPRANTMFKLTFQAFVIMGVVISIFFGFLHKKIFNKDLRLAYKTLIFIFLIFVCIYPFYSYKSYYGDFKTYKGLDGLGWLKERHPHDYEGILWLRKNSINGERVLEAVGESYTTHARVSTFSGLPTVLGWRVHEWLWRGGFDIPSQRTEEVRMMFELPLSKESLDLYKEYDIKYIFIGDLERETYANISIEELKNMGRIVFEQGDTLIIGFD